MYLLLGKNLTNYFNEEGQKKFKTSFSEIKLAENAFYLLLKVEQIFMNILIILIVVLITTLVIFITYKAVQNSEKTRQKQIVQIEQIFPSIELLLSKLDSLCQYENGYFNNYKLLAWNSEAEPIISQIKPIPYGRIKLNALKVDMINSFFFKFNNASDSRNKFNQSFVNQELKKYHEFFNHIEDRKLDDQQRYAIVTDEDNNIVVAGAGSGKTTTIVGKVSYLLDRYKVSPSEILLISFTRKACDEMNYRIKRKMNIEIDTMTFHKLGLDIIASSYNKKPTIFEESGTKNLINGFISDQMKEGDYLLKLTKFFTDYLKSYKEENEFQSKGEYIQYIKDNNIKSYKQVEINFKGKMTFLRETCKSLEEVSIANYLFLNNINYEYEKKYKYDTATQAFAQYKPDFYLTDYDVYIEHFGVDRNYNVPKWFKGVSNDSAKKKYKDGIDWKRSIHKSNKTKLIETYSYEKHEGVLELNLEKKLKEHSIEISPKTPEEIWEVLNSIAEDDITNFTQLIITFLSLLKSNNYSIEEIKDKNTSNFKGFEQLRNSAFIELFSPILGCYNRHLNDLGEIDFSDMINNATDCIVSGNSKKNYKYIIIDEFQDISIGRYKLIKSLLKANSGSKLFAVGDDFQSIYRFSGSEISIFTEFEKYFGVSSKSFIETTYRFNSMLINLSTDFILKNPNQVRKKLKAFSNSDLLPFKILYSKSPLKNDSAPVIEALDEIINIVGANEKGKKVLLLGRYSYDIDLLKNDSTNFIVRWNKSKENYEVRYKLKSDLLIEFLTVHRSKGLEADFVIILNCSSGKYGFPSEQADDPVLNLLLTCADQFPNGEERRLFYVALTRCREKVFLIANSIYKSKFIVELENNSGLTDFVICPECKTGILSETSGVSLKGKEWKKMSCSNWNWGCEYIDWLT